MGRWMSPDWADKPEAVPYSSLDNPQSLNLYGYVLNNPLSKADPDGHCCWDEVVGAGKEVLNQTVAPVFNAMSAVLNHVDPAALRGETQSGSVDLHPSSDAQAATMTAVGPAVAMATMLTGEGEASKGAEAATLTFDGARTEAFSKAGMTNPADVSDLLP
jgi:hypothetical protein